MPIQMILDFSGSYAIMCIVLGSKCLKVLKYTRTEARRVVTTGKESRKKLTKQEE